MMHRCYNRIIYVLVLAISCISCNHVNRKEGLKNAAKEYDLSSSVRKELFVASARMGLADSLLILVSLQQDNICTLYSLDTIEEVCTYGSRGNGPGEFVQPLFTYAYGGTFGLNEVNKQELIILEITKTNGNEITVRERKRIKAPYKRQKDKWVPADYYFVQLDEEHFVSLVGTENGRFFTLSDTTLIPIERFGDSPIEEELSAIAARNRFTGKIVARQGKMAFATTKLPYLAFYSIDGEQMVKEWSLYYAETAYGVKNGDLLFDKDKAMGPALDLKMDSKYIYVLYMDQLLSEYDYFDSKKSCSNKILVFDYDGNSVACLNLDCRIQEMAVSGEMLKLYGISQDSDMCLVEFDLPQELY